VGQVSGTTFGKDKSLYGQVVASPLLLTNLRYQIFATGNACHIGSSSFHKHFPYNFHRQLYVGMYKIVVLETWMVSTCFGASSTYIFFLININFYFILKNIKISISCGISKFLKLKVCSHLVLGAMLAGILSMNLDVALD
jgi:hypothetical protein